MTSVVKPVVKSAVNFNKKGYANVVEYISGNADPAIASVMLGLLREALRETVGFDPDAKKDPELQKRQNETRKQLLERENMTNYERYIKPRYERLKSEHPNVPPSVLLTMKNSDILNLV
jgi:hypothetical protein